MNVKLFFFLVHVYIFPTKITFFQSQKSVTFPLEQQLIQQDLLGKHCILMMELFMHAITQWQITPKHHFYRCWHSNLIIMMHGFPVGVITAFFGGSPFWWHACPDALAQRWYSEESVQSQPSNALAMHIFMREWKEFRVPLVLLPSYHLKVGLGRRSSGFHMLSSGLLMVPCYDFAHLQSCDYT